jgi:hypothetical protein
LLIKQAGKPETHSGMHIVSICVRLHCGTQNSRRCHRVIHYESMRPQYPSLWTFKIPHNFMYGLTNCSAVMPIFIMVYVSFFEGPGYLVPFQSAYRFSNANGRTWASLIHTYTHTYINTYIHEYKHTYVRTYIRTYIHTYSRTNIQGMNKIMEPVDSIGIKLFVLAVLKAH